ncbi:hypothetical protein M413DRAFT_449965, partial [Hebeloma cylindrosporum]
GGGLKRSVEALSTTERQVERARIFRGNSTRRRENKDWASTYRHPLSTVIVQDCIAIDVDSANGKGGMDNDGCEKYVSSTLEDEENGLPFLSLL